jgi:hypothetical protein
MKQFNYSVIITTEANRFTFETNDVREALRAVFDIAEESEQVCICNGYTGEVLYHNGEEPWCTDEMALIMLGYLIEQVEAEEEEEPHIVSADGAIADPAVALMSSLFGIPADEVVALHLGCLPS